METEQIWESRKISRIYLFYGDYEGEFQVAFTPDDNYKNLHFLDKKSCDNMDYSFNKIKEILKVNDIECEDWEIKNSNDNCSNCSCCSNCSYCFNCSDCSCLSNKENYKNNKEGENK